ncbi:MAG TPA: DNA primase [Pseudomonadales bacterium]
MGRIPQSFINDLLARIDIVDVIDGRLTLRKAGKDYQALCPFHNEKTPSFSVVPDKQFYHCFGCGASGTALTFLMEFDRLEFVEAVEELAKLAGVEVPREHRERPQQDHSDLYAVLARAERFYRQALKEHPPAVEYLRGRGLSGEVARDFGIGYAPDAWDAARRALQDVPESRLLEAGVLTRNDAGRVYDRFRGRIMFPIRDTRGRIIGFGGRIIRADDSGPKYLNSPETAIFHKGRELYGLYEARRALKRLDRLIVVEGYMDVVALAQAGVANCVATLGTAATAEHFQKLYRYTEEVICCFDGDNAGRRAAWRALESALPVLEESRQLRFMFLPEGEDPDSLVRARGREAFLEMAGVAEPAIEYLFNRLADGLDLRNVDHKARLAGLALPFIEKVPDGILRRLMSERLYGLTGIAADAGRRVGTAAPRRMDPAGAPHGRSGRASKLAERLLARLLQNPSLLLGVAPDQRERLSKLDGDDLLLEVVRYLDDNPGADTAEILGRWSGTVVHQRLVGLLQNAPALSDEALQGEVAEGVGRYLELHAEEQRRRLLAQLRQEPSVEKVAELVSLKKGNPPAAG